MKFLLKTALFGATAVAVGVTAYWAWSHFTKPTEPGCDSSDDESWEEGCAKGESQRQPPVAQASKPPEPKEEDKPPGRSGDKPESKATDAKKKKPEYGYCGFKKGFLL
ncbi:uncharacterized protein LOC110242991 [Exaiptasia diaphana]|uniref:Uncharacterized protein n=1 Tax=Exaiptasia diaphana TaxID=2652724 RepID=A0A913XI54_EXADI|nr:uncharacterized protein LOC110242991 [Exaiptasia diaphana]KXJ11860.1 hypothetical protein AC249_AIPGENE26160 [Exaiptasia diaphana]